MATSSRKIVTTVTWIAGVTAAIVALALPGSYLAAVYHTDKAVMRTEAEINARLATQIINANPELWRFQVRKFEEFLKRRPQERVAEVRRIRDLEGRLVAESADALAFPTFWQSKALLDAGVEVGRIEIGRSLRPLILQGAGVFVFGLMLGGGVFVVLRVLPIRALNRALADNLALIAQLKEREVELVRSNQDLQQFAYVASHDLQEPLRMITSYTQLLAKRYHSKLDADANEFIGYAVDGAKRMQGLINDLLAYSRVGTRGKDFGAVDCEAILMTTLQSLKVAIGESGAVIHYDPLPTVSGDGTQIGQLFQNLLGNALKYRNGNRPEIHVSCLQNENFWQFSVGDNGIGIDPQFAEKIFVIFQRLHTKEQYSGTGIGLAVCKKIVERHGGNIWVESDLGKGATFYFTIPAGPEAPQNITSVEPARVHYRESLSEGRGGL